MRRMNGSGSRLTRTASLAMVHLSRTDLHSGTVADDSRGPSKPSYPLGGRADILLHARVGWPTGYVGSAGRRGNVRRIFGYIMFTLGWLLVFLAPLLYLYTKPRVEKAPNDVYE